MDGLEKFIVAAKAATYVGNGASRVPSRTGAHDLGYERDGWHYLDSYFGGTDFLGQETVWYLGEPVWAMNYYGRILRPDLIDAAGAGRVIKASLSALYAQGRFLGGFEQDVGAARYADANSGTVEGFLGIERIFIGGTEAYRLDYHGGLIKP